MGVVMMKLKGLTELGQGRWEYRKRVPESAKAALGKSERKEVFEAKSDNDVMRKYSAVVAKIDAEIAAAKAPRKKLTPRAAWEETLRKADEMASGVVGIDDPEEAREVVAESMVSLGQADPLLVQALMDPRRSPPALTIEDAREIYVKERLGGGEGPEHRGTVNPGDKMDSGNGRVI